MVAIMLNLDFVSGTFVRTCYVVRTIAKVYCLRTAPWYAQHRIKRATISVDLVCCLSCTAFDSLCIPGEGAVKKGSLRQSWWYLLPCKRTANED